MVAEPPETKPKVMTFDEIVAGISELAQNGEGAAKTQAYRLLLSLGGGNAATIPEPKTEAELLERLARLMKACGPHLCQRAFQRAFPKVADDVWTPPLLSEDEVDYDDLPTTIPQLRKWCRKHNFPLLNAKGGFPKGYPVGRGGIVQAEWIKRAAKKIMLDFEQARVEMNAEEEVAAGALREP